MKTTEIVGIAFCCLVVLTIMYRLYLLFPDFLAKYKALGSGLKPDVENTAPQP